MFSPEDCFSHLSSISTGVTQTLDKWAPSYPVADSKYFANAELTEDSHDLKCKKCLIQFSTPSDLERHMYSLHSAQLQGLTLEQNNVEPFATLNSNDSASANARFVDSSETRQSLKTKLEQTFQCKFCSSSFSMKKNYKRHNSNVHSKEVQIEDNGNHTFNDIAVELEDITCSYCKKTFPCKRYLKQHIRKKHSGIEMKINKKLMCKMCDSSFRELQDYKHHCRKDHGKVVKIENNGQHKYTHFEEPTKPYCLPCDSTFSTVCHLKRHTRNSSAHKKAIKGTLAYTSDDDTDDEEDSDCANERFVNNSVARQSLNKTTLEQTFQCKLCSSSYAKKQNYKRHNRNVHFKEVEIDDNGNHTFTDIAVEREDITCSYCEKSFLCKTYLKRHLRTIHGDTKIKNNKEKLKCKMCDSLFSELQDYKHHCRKVHGKIVEIDTKGQHKFTNFEEPTVPYCLPCGLTFSTVCNLNRHTQKSVAYKKAIKGTQDASSDDDTDDEEDMLPYCIPCSKTFKTIKSLQLHQKTNLHTHTVRLSNNNGVGTPNHRCPICSRIYANTKELKGHLRCHHRAYYMKNKLELFPKEYTFGTIPTCEICEKEFDKYYNLKKHKLTVHNESFDMKCLHCNKAFTSIARLKKHTKYHIRKTPDLQKRTEEVKCTICNKVSSCPAKHEHHISVIHHGTALCTCSICKMAIRKPGFKNHMKRHRKNSRLKCTECKTQFGNNLALMKHKENHVDQKNQFKCDVCFKTFTNQSKLKLHMYVHNANYIPLHCKMCDRKFYDQRILDKHVKKHAKGDPKVCSYCGKQFMQDKNLQAHIEQKHLNEKPYVCEVCGKAFKQELTLKRHALVHTGEKAFQCPICYQKFSQQASVKRHMVVHSGAKPYKCKHCDKRYSQTTYLHVHVKNHHGGF